MTQLFLGDLGMAAVEAPKPAEPNQMFVQRGVDWLTYDAIIQALGDHPTRVTFDGWNLEFRSPSSAHEWYKTLFGRLLNGLSLDRNIPLSGCGCMAFRKQSAECGLEADQCYWIQNEPAVRGKLEIDLSVDPPPDLAIEID